MNILCKIKDRLTSKTYLAALSLGIVTAVDLNSGVISQFVPQEYRPLLLMFWPVVMMTLREVTSTPLTKDKNVSN